MSIAAVCSPRLNSGGGFFDDVLEAGVADGVMGDDFAVVDDAEGAEGAGNVLSCLGIRESDEVGFEVELFGGF